MPVPSCRTCALTWQCTKKSRDTGSLVRVVLGLRHIWHVTYSTIYFRRSDSMYLGTYLPGAIHERQHVQKSKVQKYTMCQCKHGRRGPPTSIIVATIGILPSESEKAEPSPQSCRVLTVLTHEKVPKTAGCASGQHDGRRAVATTCSLRLYSYLKREKQVKATTIKTITKNLTLTFITGERTISKTKPQPTRRLFTFTVCHLRTTHPVGQISKLKKISDAFFFSFFLLSSRILSSSSRTRFFTLSDISVQAVVVVNAGVVPSPPRHMPLLSKT